jgi:two-component system sensor histidine kinase HydH
MTADGKIGRRKTYRYIIVVLAAASFAILLSTALIYLNSMDAADESLRLQALGIAASLEPSLQDIRGKELFFSEVNTSAAWEGIAYIALYNKDGLTLLHSNEALIGRIVDLPDRQVVCEQDRQVTAYKTLLTGERVFVMDYPLSVGDEVRLLRIALHPYPAQNIVRQAGWQAIIVSCIVLVLWITGFFLVRAVRRSDELTALMEERERLASLGEMSATGGAEGGRIRACGAGRRDHTACPRPGACCPGFRAHHGLCPPGAELVYR